MRSHKVTPAYSFSTHVLAVGCFGNIYLLILTGSPEGDTTSCTSYTRICCFTLSPRRCVALHMYVFPHALVKRQMTLLKAVIGKTPLFVVLNIMLLDVEKEIAGHSGALCATWMHYFPLEKHRWLVQAKADG